MFPVSTEAKALFSSGARQTVDIRMFGVNEELTLTAADIPQGGLSINRSCSTGSKVELGSAIAAEMSLKLDNNDGRFDDVVFEGAEMFVRVGVKDWNNPTAPVYYVPLGYFTVDEVPRKLKTLTLKALDRMVLFDKEVDLAALAFPMSVSTLVSRCCTLCNVTLASDLSTRPNASYSVVEAPRYEGMNYRYLIQWCAEIMGSCAYMDWNGQLQFAWYTDSGETLTASNRFHSDLDENDISITGVIYKNTETTYLAGTDDYAFNLEGNYLVQDDIETMLGALGGYLVTTNPLTYRPFKADILPMPWLYPLDKLTFVDKNGDSQTVIITDTLFKLNSIMSLQGKGESKTRNGYAALNPLTRRENVIISTLTQVQNETLNTRVQTVMAFNELICNSMGLHMTPVEQPDGTVIYYLHDAPTLEESQTIFTMTAEGIAWTRDGWNGGSPVWSYGVTSAGDALFRMLSAEGITVAKAGEDYNIEITPSAFRIYYRNMLVTNIEADEMTIPKASFTGYAQWGKIRIVPYEDLGANMLYID